MQRLELRGESRLPTSETGDFDEVFHQSVSRGMMTVLGAGGAQAIFFHLGLPNFGDPKKFHERLTTIFGVGTASLEHVILQHLHQAIGVRPSGSTNEDFVKQVERVKHRYKEARLVRSH